MKQTNTLIIGSSISGLASAASLQKQGIEYVIIEKQDQVAAPWHNHYHRLHLHTNKRCSQLPYKKFGSTIPRYPSRQQVIDYLNDYQKAFNIQPVFNTRAITIKKDGAKQSFDAIVACIGYTRDEVEIVQVDKSRFDDLRVSVNQIFW